MTDAELERRVDAHLELVKVQEWVAKLRAKLLAKPLPRYYCPGCFVIISDGAAEQGWCCDCFPSRKKYDSPSTASAKCK